MSFKDFLAEATDSELLAAANAIVADLRRISDGQVGKAELQGGTAGADIRYWGQWMIPDDAEGEFEDFEDYDWEVLTPEWSKKLHAAEAAAIKKYPKLSIHFEVGEKNYIIVHVRRK